MSGPVGVALFALLSVEVMKIVVLKVMMVFPFAEAELHGDVT